MHLIYLRFIFFISFQKGNLSKSHFVWRHVVKNKATEGWRLINRQPDRLMGLILNVWLVCVNHPSLLHHALTLCFTIHLFFCSFCPCSAAAGCQENQGLSLCLQHMLCAQHRVTFSVPCIYRHLAIPLHHYNLLSSEPPKGSEFPAVQPASFSCEPSYVPL